MELPAIPENDMWQIRRNTQGNINRGIAFAGNGRAYIIEGSETHQIYDSENPPPYPVTSVNSATGAVILYQNPSVIFPEVEDTSWRIFRNAGGTTLGILFTDGKIYRINSTSHFEVYDEGNPPPYPVTSVNGQTGAVQITFPVTSVNGQTGAVNLQIPFVNTAPEILEFQTDSPGDYWGMQRTTTNGDVGIYFDSENNTVKAYITYMPEDESTQQPQTFQLLTTNDIPSSSGVVSVNGKTGVVVIRATDISRTENNAETVETALARIDQKNSTQDNAISALQGDVSKIHQSIAIIADGDTHTAIQAGQAVFVKNHRTLATGLYWANSAIGTDVALTSSNLTADSNGGLNHLQSEITTLNSKLTSARQYCTINSSYLKEGEITAFTIGNLAFIQIADLKFKSALPSSAESNAIVLATLPFNVSPSRVIFAVVKLSTQYSVVRLRIQNNAIYPWWSEITETEGEGYIGNVVINLGT